MVYLMRYTIKKLKLVTKKLRDRNKENEEGQNVLPEKQRVSVI